MNWQELSSKSHYQTAVAIQNELHAGHFAEAVVGVEELIEALSRSDKRALKSQLVRLMSHVIKWKSQPEFRSRSWTATIANARDEIKDLQTETPSLTDDVVREMWEKSLNAAKREAEAEMNRDSPIDALTWEEVFEEVYEKEEIN